MTRSLWVGVLLLVLGAHVAPAYAQEDDPCWLLCTPELELEPTVAVEPIFWSAEARNLQTGAVTSADPTATFEIVAALGIPREGDVLGGERFLEDANPWGVSFVLILPIAPLEL